MKKFLCFAAAILLLTLHGAAKTFPDADVVLLDDQETVTYQTDGTDERTDFCRYQILTYKGLKEMRTLEMHYNSTYGSLKVTQLELTKADGRTVKLDPAKLAKSGIDSSQMQSRIYDPAQKRLAVTVPDLEVGDILTVATRRRTLKPRLPGQWSDICVMQADFPILNYQYTVNAPAIKPLLATAVKDPVPGTLTHSRETQGDRIIYRWHARNVPQALPEPAMPELYTCCQRVLVSTVGKWQDISRWYDALCAPRLAKVNAAMRRKTAGLTAGKTTEMAKITALFQFVSQQIRYTGITDEEHAPGYEPHDVDQTFDRRHGVCRDKAALLVAMLRLAGIKAYPTLFMSGVPKDPEVPNIYFNHAIVAAEVNGKYVLMDPTFETTRELFPSYLAGDSFLVAKPDGDTIHTAPPVKAESNLLTINTTAELAADGRLTGKITLDFTGVYDQMYRAAFSEWDPDKIRDYLHSHLRNVLPDAAVTSLQITPANVRNMSVPLAVVMDFEYPMPSSGYLALPRLSHELGLLQMLYSATSLQQRRFPLRALPRSVKEHIAVKLPENVTITAAPENFSAEKSGILRISSTRQTVNGTFIENNFFAIDAMKIAPADYPALKTILAAAANAAGALPLVQRSPESKNANSILLDYRCHYQLLDNKNWDMTLDFKRKILNYAGVDAHSEVRIVYIDGVDEVEISGTVTSPDGKVRTLSAKELNRMDAPGAAAMPRYPRQKIAVASFPNVVAGSIIDCRIVKKSRNKTHFFAVVNLQNHTPAKQRQISFSGGKNLTALTHGDLPVTVTTRQDKKIFTATDIPALPQESSAPDLLDFAGMVTAFTPIPLAEILTALETKTAAATPEITALAQKLTRGKSGLAAVDALRKYVSLHIRNTAYPLDPGSFSLPQTTLADGYGSSADQAILLGALLKAAGIRCTFVLATDRDIPANSDRPWHRYGQVLLQLTDHPGVYLNDLNHYAILGSRNTPDRKLLGAPAQPPLYQDHVEVKYQITIAPSGSADLEIRYRYYGNDFNREFERFALFTPEMRKRRFEALAHAISPAAQVRFSAVDFTTHPGVITLKVHIPQFAVKLGRHYCIDLPEYDKFFLLPGAAAERRLPLLLQRCSRTHTYSITVPSNWQVLRHRRPFGDFHVTADGTIRIGLQLASAYRITGDITAQRRLFRRINSPDSQKVLFITE